MRCPSCGTEAGSGRFCSNCAAPLDFAGATEADPSARTPVHTPTPSKMGEMGFAPGEMFGWRYRIVGMLGQVLLLRFGLLPVSALVFVVGSASDAPLTLDPSVWYAAWSYICLATLTAFAAYGFFTVTAGRRRFSAALLEEE